MHFFFTRTSIVLAVIKHKANTFPLTQWNKSKTGILHQRNQKWMAKLTKIKFKSKVCRSFHIALNFYTYSQNSQMRVFIKFICTIRTKKDAPLQRCEVNLSGCIKLAGICTSEFSLDDSKHGICRHCELLKSNGNDSTAETFAFELYATCGYINAKKRILFMF